MVNLADSSKQEEKEKHDKQVNTMRMFLQMKQW
jgi:hypothetical protein